MVQELERADYIVSTARKQRWVHAGSQRMFSFPGILAQVPTRVDGASHLNYFSQDNFPRQAKRAASLSLTLEVFKFTTGINLLKPNSGRFHLPLIISADCILNKVTFLATRIRT